MSDLEILRGKLADAQDAVKRQSAHLRRSYEETQSSGTLSEEDRLKNEEALTARFSRLSDLLVKRCYRLVSEIDDAPATQVLDILNHAEKVGLLNSAEQMRALRLLRNRIAHEYDREPSELLSRVLEFTPYLLDCADRAVGYQPK